MLAPLYLFIIKFQICLVYWSRWQTRVCNLRQRLYIVVMLGCLIQCQTQNRCIINMCCLIDQLILLPAVVIYLQINFIYFCCQSFHFCYRKHAGDTLELIFWFLHVQEKAWSYKIWRICTESKWGKIRSGGGWEKLHFHYAKKYEEDKLLPTV